MKYFKRRIKWSALHLPLSAGEGSSCNVSRRRVDIVSLSEEIFSFTSITIKAYIYCNTKKWCYHNQNSSLNLTVMVFYFCCQNENVKSYCWNMMEFMELVTTSLVSYSQLWDIICKKRATDSDSGLFYNLRCS